MVTEQQLQSMNETALRSLARQLMSTVGEQTQVIESTQQALESKVKELHHKEALIAKLTFEMATLRRARYGRTAETLNSEQRALFEDAIDEDLAALEVLRENAAAPTDPNAAKPKRERRQPKRAQIPADLPRTDVLH